MSVPLQGSYWPYDTFLIWPGLAMQNANPSRLCEQPKEDTVHCIHVQYEAIEVQKEMLSDVL